ncbi:DUF1178 family protein [Maricaulis sp.]|uniref:DUF1178 family protein n=1 Tax=Maricaulis sp. TaxID=1486257 RepID=UPI003A8EC6B0
MIRYALVCDAEHRFEAWFSNSAAFDDQNERGLVECPQCGSHAVRKDVMSPAVSTSRQREATPESKLKAMAAQVKAHIRSNYDYVGEDFASEARAIHAGDKPERLIYGETSAEESEALRDEGVPVAPLPDALAPTPPKKAN